MENPHVVGWEEREFLTPTRRRIIVICDVQHVCALAGAGYACDSETCWLYSGLSLLATSAHIADY
jgi:hypothetical protein